MVHAVMSEASEAISLSSSRAQELHATSPKVATGKFAGFVLLSACGHVVRGCYWGKKWTILSHQLKNIVERQGPQGSHGCALLQRQMALAHFVTLYASATKVVMPVDMKGQAFKCEFCGEFSNSPSPMVNSSNQDAYGGYRAWHRYRNSPAQKIRAVRGKKCLICANVFYLAGALDIALSVYHCLSVHKLGVCNMAKSM